MSYRRHVGSVAWGCVVLLSCLCSAVAEVQAESPPGLGDVKIGSALKEALKLGTQNAVELTSAVDGYFGNQAIKILMPDKLQQLEQALRVAGQGKKVDEFVLSMNRAAEGAAPAATEIFLRALEDMTIDDASKILNGGETAATEYFRTKTAEKLASAFRPTVAKVMGQLGVVRLYRELLDLYQALPVGKKSPTLDLESYVVDKALHGLFHVLAQEERKIRTDPAARATELLRDVFGK